MFFIRCTDHAFFGLRDKYFVLPFQKKPGLINLLAVVCLRYITDTGSGATVNLVFQTGAGTGGGLKNRKGSQTKVAIDEIDRLAAGGSSGVRAKIKGAVFPYFPRNRQTGEWMICGKLEADIGFVVF